MDKKRKISARKIMQTLLTLVVTVGCVVAISGASNKEIKKNITGLEINIRNDRHKFVDEQQIRDVLRAAYGPDITLVTLNNLRTGQIETEIKKNKWVANAQVYVDNARMLHINVTQRVPVARIFEENGNTYYIDRSMNIMPVSDKYSYYTTVVTGVPHVENDSISRSLLGQVAYMVRHIERDTFWNAQVSQIIMAPDMTFEIVPVLGTQRILLGDTSMLDQKLENLFAFYKNVLNRIGWDRYDKIDLSYKGQIVASPALQWKMPQDKMLTELKWVETIKAKAAYNKNVFSLDSNDVAVVRRQEPVVAVIPEPEPVRESAQQMRAGSVAARAEPKPAPVQAAAKKPVQKQEAKPAVKIGPMPDVDHTPVVKKAEAKQSAQPEPKLKPAAKTSSKVEPKKLPAAKPADKKPAKPKADDKKVTKATDKKAETKKVNDKKVANAKKDKLPLSSAKKTIKKEDKKANDKQTKDKKDTKPKAKENNKQKENKQQTAKYIYQSNNH
jgi:cell division protein FtsQ